MIPLLPGTKRPLYPTGGGHLDGAVRDPQSVLDETADFMAEHGSKPGWGIVTGGLLAVLDLDGEEAESWLTEFGKQYPSVALWTAQTVRVRTAHGFHLYGAVPQGISIRNSASRIGPSVDVRGEGGYVVSPGTRHPSGTWYELMTDVEANATATNDDPDALLSLFHEMRGEGDDFIVDSVAALSIPAPLLDVLRDHGAAGHVERPQTPVFQLASDASGGSALPDEKTARRRADALIREIGETRRGNGISCTNWAVYHLAALHARHPEVVTEEDRVAALDAYAGRVPGEFDARRKKAAGTARNAWSAGNRDSDKVLAKEGADWSGIELVLSAADPVEAAGNSSSAAADLEDEFFSSRALLTRLRDFARTRRVSPWALLGAILARAAAAVPPSVVLPPTIGSVASLNPFIALCGVSGSGKSAVTEVARDFLIIAGGVETLETAPGSGEGLITAYVHSTSKNGKVEMVQTCASVLLEVDEVQALGSLTTRTASTLQPFLKSAWSGKMLGTQNADPTRQRRVGAHEYRLAITAGVQPANASILLDDVAGGFPQRWLWLPTYDAGMFSRDVEAVEPEPFNWRVPAGVPRVESDSSITLPVRTVMQLPDEAVEAILDAAEKRNRPIGASLAGADALDGHALLCRAKVTALLALLDGRGETISSEDWALAGIVMQVSDSTRDEIVRVNAQTARSDADKKAERQGRSAAIAADAQVETRTDRARAKIIAQLANGERPKGKLKNALRRYRGEFEDALKPLIDTEIVEVVERKNNKGKKTLYLRLAGGAK